MRCQMKKRLSIKLSGRLLIKVLHKQSIIDEAKRHGY